MDPTLYQMLAIKTGLRAYAKHKMLLNRMWTPKRMMATAARLCECSFKPRDYEGAAKALERAAEKRAELLKAQAAVKRSLGDEFGQAL